VLMLLFIPMSSQIVGSSLESYLHNHVHPYTVSVTSMHLTFFSISSSHSPHHTLHYPKAGATAYPTTNSSPCLKHYFPSAHPHKHHNSSHPLRNYIETHKLTVHSPPTPSSSPGANTLPT
jgi:hypothetical protein